MNPTQPVLSRAITITWKRFRRVGSLVVLILLAEAASSSAEQAATSAPAEILARADDLAHRGQYDDALGHLDDALAADGALAVKAAIVRARVMHLTGRYTEALSVLQAVEDGGKEQASWHLARARQLEAKGDYEEALDACRAGLGLDADDLEARYRCARLYEITGRRGPALRLYQGFERIARQRVPDSARDLVWHGRGFYRATELTRHPNLAGRVRYILHELYQPAYEVKDPTYWPARIASGQLLLDKYNLREAAEDFKAALKINPNLPDALVGLASAALETYDFENCEKLLDRALAVNPNHVPSHNATARLKLTERRDDLARTWIDRALGVNPNDPEALALGAAVAVRLSDEAAAADFEKRLAAINPTSPVLHHSVATWLSAVRQFPEAEPRFKRAIDLDATWAEPRIELGLMYMQWGREDQARTVLEEAWQRDPFNRKAYNTLQLLDKLKAFDTVETDNVLFRYDANQDAVLALYAPDYVETIWPELCRAYDFEPEEKTIIEVFPSHQAFSVRITARPWIHTIGASTGRVVAMDAPRKGASPNGPFNWALVLRHELTHTLTLAATRNRIPHWFTEALAVGQENTPRSYRWMRLLSIAVRRGGLFPIGEINWSFIRPKRATDREQAYAQSEWMAEYITATKGYQAILDMLGRFRQGHRQPEILGEVLGMSEAEFDRAFAAWAKKQVATWGLSTEPIPPTKELKERVKAKPDDAEALARLAEGLFLDGNLDEAKKAAARALELDKDNVRALTVHCRVVAAVWQAMGSRSARSKLGDEVRPILERLARLDEEGSVAPRYLALLAMREGDLDAARPWVERLRRVCPHDPVAHRGFAALRLKQGDREGAVRELTALAMLDEHEVEHAVSLAGLCAKLGQVEQTARWLEQAIRIDPYDADLHEQAASTYLKLNRREQAVREYRALGALEPTKADHFARLAIQLHRLGRKKDAAEAARKALELDPDSPVKQLLEK